MGNNVFLPGNRPGYIPASNEKPSFDPQYGFKAPRKPREVKISEEELIALQVPKQQRDYCAYLIKDLLVCQRQYGPLYGMCNPELHAYEHCQIEDYILRMKEYEREKRLRMRELKKKEKKSVSNC